MFIIIEYGFACSDYHVAGRHLRHRMRFPGMNDNPIQIVDDLIGQHGVDGALETVRDGIAAAKANGDNYRLSVWREVRQVLQAKTEAADN